MAARDNSHTSDSLDKTPRNSDARINAKRTNPFRWTLGLLVRLCIWYTLLTPFFRCPSRLSELNETSPAVCKPYLVARSYIEPHVLPYYDTYAAPYVDAARPYIHIVNEKVYTPSVNVAKVGYDKYGAPALQQVQAYGQQQYAAQVAPHLQTVKDKANTAYTSQIAPYVQQVDTALSPYYHKANSIIRSTCQDYILPFYAQSMPFIGKTYASGQDVLVTTVLPYAQSTWSSALIFANSSLWPKIAGLYSENVEPQLVKIGQRLASYREGKQYQKVVDETDISPDHEASTTSSSTTAKVEASTTSTVMQASQAPERLSAAEIEVQTREKIASDLQTWKEKFAVAVDNAVENLEARIGEMADSYAAGEAKHSGEIIVTNLEAVVEQETANIKRRINTLAESLPAEDFPEEEEKAQEALVKDVRESAITIRDQAHSLREWHNSFNEELLRLVSAPVHSTLSVLDSVRDLGFQEIGQRWAWMDGVTYKDWENYHSLKAEFEVWRNQFLEARMKHPKLEDARSVSEDILAQGMGAAEAAAKELARLKGVGQWKITARESSDDFETRTEPPPVPPKPITIFDEDSTASTENEPKSDANGSYQTTEFSDVESEDFTVELDNKSSTETEQSSVDQDSQKQESHVAEPLKDEAEITVDQNENEDESRKLAWGAEAAEIVLEQATPETEDFRETVDPLIDHQIQDPVADVNDMARPSDSDPGDKAADAPSNQAPQYGTVEDLVNKLLADKDSEFAADIRLKLQAIYGNTAPNPTSVSQAPEQQAPPSATSSAIEIAVENAEENVSTTAEAVPPSLSPSPEPDVEDSADADAALGSDEFISHEMEDISVEYL